MIVWMFYIASCSFTITFVASFISYFNIYFITWFDWISSDFEISFIISCACTNYFAVLVCNNYWSIWLIWMTFYDTFIWVAISWVVCINWSYLINFYFWSCSINIYATRYFFASITCLINDLSCYAWSLTINYWYFDLYMTSCFISICYRMRLLCATIYSVFDNITYYCICWDRNFSCCISVITITAVFSFI